MPHFFNTRAQACHCQVLNCWPCLLPHTRFNSLQHLSMHTHLNVCISHLPNSLPWMCSLLAAVTFPSPYSTFYSETTAMYTQVGAIHTYIYIDIVLLLHSVNCHCEAFRDHLKTNSQQVFTVIIIITYTQ